MGFNGKNALPNPARLGALAVNTLIEIRIYIDLVGLNPFPEGAG
jgi:hypothetical protein